MTKSQQLHAERKRRRLESYHQALAALGADPGHPRSAALQLLSGSIAEMEREIQGEGGAGSARGRYLAAMRDRLLIRFNSIFTRARTRRPAAGS